MTAQEIIEQFETKVDDTTELSSVQELALLNEVYMRIASERPWEILKFSLDGTMVTEGQIPLPSNFAYFPENMNETDNSYSTEINQKPVGAYITLAGASAPTPFRVVNWSDRRQYANSGDIAYLDLANSRLVVPNRSGLLPYSIDYVGYPTALTLGATPVFPAAFHYLFVYRMAASDMAIQMFDKARSYRNENLAEAADILQDMQMWNSRLINN
jgi:hypothetical protein